MVQKMKRIFGSLLILSIIGIWAGLIITAQNRNTATPFGIFRLSTATNTATLTTSQVSPGLLIGTPTGTATYTLPTATALCSAWPGIALFAPGTNSNFGYDLTIRNEGAGGDTITLGASAGVTLEANNTNTVASANTRIFKFVPTSCSGGNNPSGVNTWTVYSSVNSTH